MKDIRDLIFFLVKFNKGITVESLFYENAEHFAHYHLTMDDVEHIIQQLISENKVYLDSNDKLRIAPGGYQFKGYAYEELRAGIEKNSMKRRDLVFKIIPILLTIIFGLASAYFSYINYSLNSQLAKNKVIIDSLQRVIK